LGNLSVELELLSLESRDNLLTEVNGDKILKLGHLHDLTLGGLNGVGEGSSVTRVLEEGSHGFLSGVEVVKVGLSRLLLGNQLHLFFGDTLSGNNGSGDSLEVEDLSLGPVEHVDEGVLHLVTSADELVLEAGVGGVVEDEAGGTHVDVGSKVNFLIDVPHASKIFVVVDGELLGGEELRKLVLQVLEVGLNLLHEEGELGESLGELLLLGQVVHGVVDFHSDLASLVKLFGGHEAHVVEGLLNVGTALGTRETLELRGFDNELEASELAEELLEVEATFLDENHVFVSNGLLWGNGRDWDTGPSLGDGSVEDEEFIESTVTSPLAKGFFILSLVPTSWSLTE